MDAARLCVELLQGADAGSAGQISWYLPSEVVVNKQLSVREPSGHTGVFRDYNLNRHAQRCSEPHAVDVSTDVRLVSRCAALRFDSESWLSLFIMMMILE
jgi:hypothetical protein